MPDLYYTHGGSVCPLPACQTSHLYRVRTVTGGNGAARPRPPGPLEQNRPFGRRRLRLPWLDRWVEESLPPEVEQGYRRMVPVREGGDGCRQFRGELRWPVC